MSFKFRSTKRNYNNEKKMVTAWYSKNVKDWIVHYKLKLPTQIVVANFASAITKKIFNRYAN